MIITYQATRYAPELVTGRYVRLMRAGVYRVFETATCTDRRSRSYGRAGFGPTLREYDTDGADIPADLRERLRVTRNTLEWPITSPP